MKERLTSIESFDCDEDKVLINNIPYVSGAAPTPEFFQRTLESLGVAPGFGMPFTYDCLRMMVDAFEQSPNPNKDRSDALAYVHSIKNRVGAVGTLSVDANGIFHSPASLYKYVNGKATPITLEEVK